MYMYININLFIYISFKTPVNCLGNCLAKRNLRCYTSNPTGRNYIKILNNEIASAIK